MKPKGGLTHCVPTPHILLGYWNRNWYVPAAIAELIDNSFGIDRGNAGKVTLTWDRETATLDVLDDGRGMPAVSNLFVLGQSIGDGKNDIGRYGQGGSMALFYLANSVKIWTLNEHGLGYTRQDIQRAVFKPDFFMVDDSRSSGGGNLPAELEAYGHGTLIRLSLRKERRVNHEAISKELSKLYGPGLRKGQRRIVWRENGNAAAIRPWDPGDREYSESAEIQVRGMAAFVEASVAPDVSIRDAEMSISWCDREIFRTREPFGAYSGGRIWGRIELRPEWKPFLTTNKDGLTDDGLRFELMAAANAAILPVLKYLEEENDELLEASLRLEAEITFGPFLRKIVRSITADVADKKKPTGPHLTEQKTHGGEAPKLKRVEGDDVDTPEGVPISVKGATDSELNGRFVSGELKLGQAFLIRFNKDIAMVAESVRHAEPRNLFRLLISEAFAVELVRLNLAVKAGLCDEAEYEELGRHGKEAIPAYIMPRILKTIRRPEPKGRLGRRKAK